MALLGLVALPNHAFLSPRSHYSLLISRRSTSPAPASPPPLLAEKSSAAVDGASPETPVPPPQYTGYQLENGTWVDEFGPRNGPPMNYWKVSAQKRLDDGREELLASCAIALAAPGSDADAEAKMCERLGWFEGRESKRKISLSPKVEGEWELAHVFIPPPPPPPPLPGGSGSDSDSDSAAPPADAEAVQAVEAAQGFLRRYALFQAMAAPLSEGEKMLRAEEAYEQELRCVPRGDCEDGNEEAAAVVGTFSSPDGLVQRTYDFAQLPSGVDDKRDGAEAGMLALVPRTVTCTYLDADLRIECAQESGARMIFLKIK